MYSLSGGVQHVLDEAQVVVLDLYGYVAMPRCVLYLDPIAFDQRAGKAKGGAVVTQRKE